MSSLLKISNAPNDGNHNGSTAKQIYENENVLPSFMLDVALFAFFDNYVGDICQNLKKNINEA